MGSGDVDIAGRARCSVSRIGQRRRALQRRRRRLTVAPGLRPERLLPVHARAILPYLRARPRSTAHAPRTTTDRHRHGGVRAAGMPGARPRSTSPPCRSRSPAGASTSPPPASPRPTRRAGARSAGARNGSASCSATTSSRSDQCGDGDRRACDQARLTYAEMQVLLPSIPVEPDENEETRPPRGAAGR